MDVFALDIKIIPDGSRRNIDGIDFESVAIVIPKNECTLAQICALNDALIVSEELGNSLSGTGKYLIFTNASGIADDGGWTGVHVDYKESRVFWDFFAGEERFNLIFDFDAYRSEINKILVLIAGLPRGIELEPSQVVFPESW